MIIATDNINAMNPLVSHAMASLDAAPIRHLALKLERAGAQLIDINPGHLSARKLDRMKFLVETVQEASGPGLILDSPDPKVIAAGLESCDTAPLISAVTPDKKVMDGIVPLAVEKDAQLVVLVLNDVSMPPASIDEKISIALEVAEYTAGLGLPRENLVFDPVLPNLSWPDFFPLLGESIKMVRMLSIGEIFGEPRKTIAGLSNLLSAQRNMPHPPGIEETTLAALAGAGLSIVLCNILRERTASAATLLARLL